MGRIIALVGIVALVVGGAAGYWAGGRGFLAPGGATAQQECFTFSETGKTVCGRFLEYWRQNGGLAQQGLPLSEAFEERSGIDGRVYTVQYFERAVFELHPENNHPYDVLLSLLGSEKFAGRVAPGAPTPRIGQRAIAGGYAVTLHQVRDPVAPEQYSKPQAGHRWVSVDVSVENTGQTALDYNRFYSRLKTLDNREYQPTSGPLNLTPRLGSGTQPPGDITRGWITFAAQVGAPLATFSYDPTFGKNRVVFDLRP